MEKIYFIADTHFGDERILKYENRPFASAEQIMPYANLFGHVHGSPIFKDYSRQHYCVSVERIDYSPKDFEEIKKSISEI